MATISERARPATDRPKHVRLAIGGVVVLVLATVAVWGFVLADDFPHVPGFELSVEEVERTVRSWGMWGVAGAIALMVLHSFVPFPAEIVAMANGMLYGPLWGTVITWTGAMLGAYLAFGLARWLGRPFVLQMVARRHHEKLDDWVTRQGGGMLLLSRFVPVISFNLINYAAGLTAISWWTFTWATGLGILPLTFLMVLMGNGLWSGDAAAWVWLLPTAAAGWLIWWALTRRGA